MNPLLAVVKGVAKSADDAVKSARTRMMEQVAPSPSMAYNLGMGIGPMLQAVVAEIKKNKDSKKDKTDTANASAETKAALQATSKQTKLLSTQLGSMVTLLKDIKNIGLVQLRNEQLKAFESRRQTQTSKITSILKGEGTTNVTEKQGIGASLLGGVLETTAKMLPGILKVALVGGGLYSLWESVFDDRTRETLKSFVFGKDYDPEKSLTDIVLEKVWNSWNEAFDADPLTTIVGTGLAAWATGLLGLLGVAGKVVWGSGKLLYNIGAYVGKGMTPPPPTPQGPTPSATLPPIPTTVQKTGAEAQKLPGLQTGNEAGPTSKMPNVSATEPAAASTVSKWAGIGSLLSKAGTILSGSLAALGSIFSGIAAYEEAQQGKTISATLHGMSAVTGTAALATAATGVGLAATPWLAGASLLTGVAGSIASFFESPSRKAPVAEGPAPSSTPASPRMDFKGGPALSQQEIMKLIEFKFGAAGYKSPQIWAAIANAARESGIGQNNHTPSSKEDSWGLFQMNRRGGLGQGYTPEQLLDPGFNTQLLLNALQQAESAKGYFGDNARGFRNATSKEEAAEYLRRFLFGNGTAEQQAQGMQRQSSVNQMVEAGKFGKIPEFTASASSLAGAPSTYMPGPSQISASTVGSADADSGSLLSEVTALVNDLTRQMMGGGITMVDQSNKSTNVRGGTSGGGGGVPAYVHDTIKSSVTGLAYPAERGFM